MMRKLLSSESTTIGTDTNFWPVLIDMMASVLMVFLLITFLQTALNIEDLEAITTRNKQTEFIKMFQKEFSNEIREKNVAIQQKLNLLQITFGDNILFETGKYELRDVGKDILRRSARLFAEASSTGYKQIQVEGHTDDAPITRTYYPSDNWELSAARAISVVQFLISERVLDAQIFSANGYAYHKPIAANDTAEGRAKNRRIEIRLFFSLANLRSEEITFIPEP